MILSSKYLFKYIFINLNYFILNYQSKSLIIILIHNQDFELEMKEH